MSKQTSGVSYVKSTPALSVKIATQVRYQEKKKIRQDLKAKAANA